MKETTLIETAKMQGNMMVRWLSTRAYLMTPIKWFRSVMKSLIPVALCTRALTRISRLPVHCASVVTW